MGLLEALLANILHKNRRRTSKVVPTHRTPLPTLAVTQPNEMSCVCWTCVPQGTIQVIQERGKFKKFADPGCHWVIPCLCQDVAGALSTRVQALDVAVETKTKDNVFVTIIVSTQYMVLRESSRMYDAFYKLTDSREQIRSSSSTSSARRCPGSTWTTSSPPKKRSPSRSRTCSRRP